MARHRLALARESGRALRPRSRFPPVADPLTRTQPRQHTAGADGCITPTWASPRPGPQRGTPVVVSELMREARYTGMTDSAIASNATTLTTGAWFGRK